MIVKFKKLTVDAVKPTRAHHNDAAFDLYLAENCFLPANSRTVGKTGIAIQLPDGYCADVRPRSGHSCKGLPGKMYIAETEIEDRFNADVLLGTIDEGYIAEIGIIMSSHDNRDFYIPKGTKVAQLFIHPYVKQCAFEETDVLSDTVRGNNGFGSSGM